MRQTCLGLEWQDVCVKSHFQSQLLRVQTTHGCNGLSKTARFPDCSRQQVQRPRQAIQAMSLRQGTLKEREKSEGPWAPKLNAQYSVCSKCRGTDPGLSGHIFSYVQQPEMNVSEAMKAVIGGLEGENSPPKLLVCEEVAGEANTMQSYCKETWFHSPGFHVSPEGMWKEPVQVASTNVMV